MKRFFSALLVLCLLFGFVPVMGASASEAEASKSGITIVFDYASQMPLVTGNDAASEATMQKFTFDSSNGLWAYAAYHGSDVRYRNKSVIQLAEKTYWVAMEIYVPKSGLYDIEQKYTTYSGSGTLDMYVIPKGSNTSFSISLTSGVTPVLSQSCDGANGSFKALATPAVAENVYFDAGRYYVVYMANGGRAMFGNLTLNGGSGREVVDFDVAIPEAIAVGATGSVSVVAHYSNATSESYTGSVTYTSKNSDILRFSENGTYEALSAGAATVTVTINGIEKDVVFNVQGPSGITVAYDYTALMPDAGSMQSTAFEMSNLSFEGSHGLWGYAAYYGGDIRFRGKSVIQLEVGNYWFAMEVYVPKSGMYTLEQKYTTYPSSGTLEVYAVPKGDNEAYANSLISGRSPVLTQSCTGTDNAFKALATPAVAENVYFNAGRYYIVYKAVGGRAMFGNLTLKGGSGKAVTEITSLSAPEKIKTNAPGTITANVYYSDLTSGTAAAGDVTFESSNTSILEIDAETGAYTAKAGGNVTVTAKAGPVSKSIDLTVEEVSRSGISASYNWGTQMKTSPENDPVPLKDATFLSQFTFGNSHNLWEYENQQSWSTVTWRAGDFIQFSRSGGGLWMAFEIYVPKKGIYTIEQSYAQFGGSQSNIDVYMFQKANRAAFAQGDMTADRKVLTLDCKGAAGTGLLGQTPAKKDIELEAGYYYVAYLQVKTADGTNVALFGDLTLNGGDGKAVMEIASVSVPSEIKTGTRGKASSEVYYSDLTTGTAAAGEVTYESNATDIIDIDATTGAYTAKAVGSATITATSGASSKSVEVTVKEPTMEDAFEVTETPVAGYVESTVTGLTDDSAIAAEKNSDGTFTLTAPETKENAKFLYWAKGMSRDKKIISFSATLSDYMPEENGKNYLIAVYEDDISDTAEYYNANGQRIATGTEPALPSMAGYGEATGWEKYEGTNIYVAHYDLAEPQKNINIIVTGGEGTGVYAYGDTVNCVANGTGTFKCWTKTLDDNTTEIVSADREYSFKAWESCTVTAVYEDYNYTGSKMKIVMDSFFAGNTPAVMAEFIGFGSNVVEKGIMFGETKIAMTTPGNQFTVTGSAGDVFKGYAIVKNGADYSLIIDGEVTLSDAE